MFNLSTNIYIASLATEHLNAIGGLNRFQTQQKHDDVIRWKHFPRYWPFVRGIDRSSVNSPHTDLLLGALMCSSICVGINSWVSNSDAGDFRRRRAHYGVTVINTEGKDKTVMIYCLGVALQSCTTSI